MPNIRFTKNHHSSSVRFWTWREFNRKMQAAKEEDEAQAEEFSTRAAEVREQLDFLLSAGLSEGAEEALNAMAEGDMTDFCIMVDLAEPIDIPDVEPLSEDVRKQLHNFLDGEPWHSLVVDNDITVTLASLDAIGANAKSAIAVPLNHLDLGFGKKSRSVVDNDEIISSTLVFEKGPFHAPNVRKNGMPNPVKFQLNKNGFLYLLLNLSVVKN